MSAGDDNPPPALPEFHQPGLDYYGFLELDQAAEDGNIKEAFRKLAVKHHPLRNPQRHAEDPDHFRLICESYDVLSQPQMRAIYDQYGEVGLKRGVPLPHGETSVPYIFCGDPESIFERFFGTSNPYGDLVATSVTEPLSQFHNNNGMTKKKKPDALVTPLRLTLEEIYSGCLKKVRASRRVLTADGTSTVLQEKILTVRVGAGWPKGKTITFPGEGDQAVNTPPRDLIFVLEDLPHRLFRREGIDLIYYVKIPLLYALTGTSLDVPTLDGRVLRFTVHDLISPGFRKAIRGEGMPEPQNSGVEAVSNPPQPGRRSRGARRGDLILEFDVEFPRSLTRDQRHSLRTILMPINTAPPQQPPCPEYA